MKRKVKISMLVFFSLLILAGWGKKSVELLNDKKLIDLNAAIGICIPGTDAPESNPDTEKDPAEVTPPVEEKDPPEGGGDSEAEKEPQEALPRTIVISVRDQSITYDGLEWPDADALEERIRLDYKGKNSFCLVDDFAEAHVYKKLIAVLEKLESELGITYIRD